jgi:hypothetical protein
MNSQAANVLSNNPKPNDTIPNPAMKANNDHPLAIAATNPQKPTNSNNIPITITTIAAALIN